MLRRKDGYTKSASKWKHIFRSCSVLLVFFGSLLTNLAFAESFLDSTAITSAEDDAAREEWAYSLGLQAYVFGLPLVS